DDSLPQHLAAASQTEPAPLLASTLSPRISNLWACHTILAATNKCLALSNKSCTRGSPWARPARPGPVSAPARGARPTAPPGAVPPSPACGPALVAGQAGCRRRSPRAAGLACATAPPCCDTTA